MSCNEYVRPFRWYRSMIAEPPSNPAHTSFQCECGGGGSTDQTGPTMTHKQGCKPLALTQWGYMPSWVVEARARNFPAGWWTVLAWVAGRKRGDTRP